MMKKMSRRYVSVNDNSDRVAGRNLFNRLNSNSRWSRGKPADHHYRYCHIAGYNAHLFEKNKLLYQRTPYHENSCYFIFAHDRRASDFGGLSRSRSERLHLFLHGICPRRRSFEYEGQEECCEEEVAPLNIFFEPCVGLAVI